MYQITRSRSFPVLPLILLPLALGAEVRVATTTPDGLPFFQGSTDSGMLMDLSADGRLALFTSSRLMADTNLYDSGPEFTNSASLYVRDVVSGVMRLVSLTESGGTSDRDYRIDSLRGALSGDGRHVAFLSGITSPSDNDVYLRDIAGGTTVQLTRTGDGADPDGLSGRPVISHDGRYVLFPSVATNLDVNTSLLAPVESGQANLFLYDRVADTLSVAALAPDGSALAAAPSGFNGNYDISPDGRYILYVTVATNAHPEATGNGALLYRRDLQTGTVEVVSRDAAGIVVNGTYSYPKFSGDGGTVAFRGQVGQFGGGTLISGFNPFFTESHVYVKDLGTGLVWRATQTTDGAAPSGFPLEYLDINYKGDKVIFASLAANYLQGDSGLSADIFVATRAGDGTVTVECPSQPFDETDARLPVFASGADVYGFTTGGWEEIITAWTGNVGNELGLVFGTLSGGQHGTTFVSQPLEVFGNGSFQRISFVNSVSADGIRAAGSVSGSNILNQNVYWDSISGTYVPFLPDGTDRLYSPYFSSDFTSAFGLTPSSGLGQQLLRYEEGGGLTPITTPVTEDASVRDFLVSADGSTVIMKIEPLWSTGLPDAVFRYTQAGGFEEIPVAAENLSGFNATGVNADGTVVVGHGTDATDYTSIGWIWRAGQGLSLVTAPEGTSFFKIFGTNAAGDRFVVNYYDENAGKNKAAFLSASLQLTPLEQEVESRGFGISPNGKILAFAAPSGENGFPQKAALADDGGNFRYLDELLAEYGFLFNPNANQVVKVTGNDSVTTLVLHGSDGSVVVSLPFTDSLGGGSGADPLLPLLGSGAEALGSGWYASPAIGFVFGGGLYPDWIWSAAFGTYLSLPPGGPAFDDPGGIWFLVADAKPAVAGYQGSWAYTNADSWKPLSAGRLAGWVWLADGPAGPGTWAYIGE